MAVDPTTALIRLRAEVVRLAHEVDALADLPSIRDVRRQAPELARRMRDAAMTREMVDASARGSGPFAAAKVREAGGTGRQ